jgi:DNA-binding NarL/FixJ family response regulator
MSVKLLIVDDHQLFLDGIVSLLQTESRFQIDIALDGYEALEKTKTTSYDVCLLDIGMPKLDGISTVRKLSETRTSVKIIILSTYNDKEIVLEMTKCGVAGYLLKNCTKGELLQAIDRVVQGGRYFSEEINTTLVNQLTSYRNQSNLTSEAILTPREIEIVNLLAKEYTNDRIAKALNISFRTVETHRKNIMQKTNSHNLAGLLRFAYEHRLI